MILTKQTSVFQLVAGYIEYHKILQTFNPLQVTEGIILKEEASQILHLRQAIPYSLEVIMIKP